MSITPNTPGAIPNTPDLYAEAPASIPNEIAEMWDFARKTGFAHELEALHRPRLFRSLLAAATDWALIVLATAATLEYGWAVVPFSLLVIGCRQRALGNILHDASHWSFDANRKRSTILANLLLCWPMWVTMAIYRNEHNRHHRFLGDPARDPDFIHNETRLSRGWVSVWLDQLRSPQMMRASILGHIVRMDAASLAGVFVWWAAVLGLIALASSANVALVLLALWIAARATVFHAVTSFREISDHVGMRPGSLIGFTRNHPFSGVLGEIFHPHNNGYHLLHHLTPGIPFHAMARAHALLLGWPPYATGEQCDSYFRGENSAVHSWVRRWAPGDTDSD